MPRGDGPFAVVVPAPRRLLAGAVRPQLAAAGRATSRRGRAVWNIEYRRLGTGGGWPATFDDVAAAMDHLAARTTPGSISPPGRRRALGGRSAGAVGGGAAGLPDDAPGAGPRLRLAGAVAQAGVVDLEAARLRLSDGVVLELLGGGPEERQSATRSPLQPSGCRSACRCW